MGDMPRRKLIREMEKAGFAYSHSEGGHDYYERGPLKVGVPQHKKDIKDPLLGRILRETGLKCSR